jgi:hypothetical protein
MQPAIAYRSHLHEMTQRGPTCLWNDSVAAAELAYSIEQGLRELRAIR